MRFLLSIAAVCSCLSAFAAATILENGQVRLNPYPGQAPTVSLDNTWRVYKPDSKEISYKGRWDSQHISWWSAPGFKLGFSGSRLAVSFGQHTSPGVLVAYRYGGQPWQFSNVTANATYQFISPETRGFNLTPQGAVRTFELRVTNWSYGVQVAGIAIDRNDRLARLRKHAKMIEIIGDSLAAGMYGTYEGISSWAWGFAEGLGNVEFSITAYPGICLHDQDCWGNPRGQTYQWYRVSDTSWRASQIYGDNPPKWDFSRQQPADLVVINIGTNDENDQNNVTSSQYYNSYVELVQGIHRVWPKAQIVLHSLWHGFGSVGDSYEQDQGFFDEIHRVSTRFDYVHLFNTTGILQHNDIGPQWHPTDVGQIKVASHLLQYVKQKFGYEFAATGPEVQSHTLYWNDEQNY